MNDGNGPLINKECPCKDCNQRKEACHASCEAYNHWKSILDRNNHARWEDDQKYAITDHKRRWMNRYMRRNRK